MGPSGLYAGLLCQNTMGLCAPTSTTYVGAQSLIIMSGSDAVITHLPAGTVDISATGSGSITFNISDVNNQPMPAKTTVALAGPTGITVGNPSSFTIPCTFGHGPSSYSFSLARSGAAGSGVATLTVTTPGGVVTIQQVSLIW